MKSKLSVMQNEDGWMVVEAEGDCGTVLVDRMMTEAEAQACLKRLDGFAARLQAPFLVPLEGMVEEKVEQMLAECRYDDSVPF